MNLRETLKKREIYIEKNACKNIEDLIISIKFILRLEKESLKEQIFQSSDCTRNCLLRVKKKILRKILNLFIKKEKNLKKILQMLKIYSSAISLLD